MIKCNDLPLTQYLLKLIANFESLSFSLNISIPSIDASNLHFPVASGSFRKSVFRRSPSFSKLAARSGLFRSERVVGIITKWPDRVIDNGLVIDGRSTWGILQIISLFYGSARNFGTSPQHDNSRVTAFQRVWVLYNWIKCVVLRRVTIVWSYLGCIMTVENGSDRSLSRFLETFR